MKRPPRINPKLIERAKAIRKSEPSTNWEGR